MLQLQEADAHRHTRQNGPDPRMFVAKDHVAWFIDGLTHALRHLLETYFRARAESNHETYSASLGNLQHALTYLLLQSLLYLEKIQVEIYTMIYSPA